MVFGGVIIPPYTDKCYGVGVITPLYTDKCYGVWGGDHSPVYGQMLWCLGGDHSPVYGQMLWCCGG